jgi:pimeloyl-ACP methyl ester carboxylesterase
MGTSSHPDTHLPLLLLAGTACDERVFAPVLARLDHPDVHAVVIDGARSARDAARRVLGNAPLRFDLAGFSLGGITALEMAAQEPDRIARLAFIDTNPRPDTEANAVKRRAAVERARKDGMASFITDAWPNLVSPANVRDEELKAVIVAMAETCGPDRLADQAEIAIHRADSRPRLGAINVPTLILAGADENVVPPEATEDLRRGIPHAAIHLIPDAGHFLPLENPAATALHMREWLARTTA